MFVLKMKIKTHLVVSKTFGQFYFALLMLESLFIIECLAPFLILIHFFIFSTWDHFILI
jgi:hypothetical protein